MSRAHEIEGFALSTIWLGAFLSFTFNQPTPPDWFEVDYVALVTQRTRGNQRPKRYMLTPMETPDEIRSISRLVYRNHGYALLRHPEGVLFTIISDEVLDFPAGGSLHGETLTAARALPS